MADYFFPLQRHLLSGSTFFYLFLLALLFFQAPCVPLQPETTAPNTIATRADSTHYEGSIEAAKDENGPSEMPLVNSNYVQPVVNPVGSDAPGDNRNSSDSNGGDSESMNYLPNELMTHSVLPPEGPTTPIIESPIISSNSSSAGSGNNEAPSGKDYGVFPSLKRARSSSASSESSRHSNSTLTRTYSPSAVRQMVGGGVEMVYQPLSHGPHHHRHYRCGVSRMGIPPRRILNGLDSTDGDWPWVVYLSSGCTGSIISRRHVLSAAHCAFKPQSDEPIDFANFTITAGTTNLHPHIWPQNGRRYSWRPRKVFIHPNYRVPDLTSPDMAVFQLSQPIRAFDGWIERICMPREFREYYGQIAHIVGWGADNRTDNFSRTFYAEEQVIPLNHPSKCLHHFRAMSTRDRPMHFDPNQFICGGGRFKGTETGDSGGPLMMNEKGRWYQVGLTSYGELSMDEHGLFDVGAYTRVAENCDWIEMVTKGEVHCVDMELSPPRGRSAEYRK